MARNDRSAQRSQRHRHGSTGAARHRGRAAALAVVLIASGAVVGGVALYESTRDTSAATSTAGRTPTPAPTAEATLTATPTESASGALLISSPSPVAALWQQTLPAASPLLTPKPLLRDAADTPTTAGLAHMLAPLLADPALAGDEVAVVVADAATGRSLFDHDGSDAVVPASTAKLAVAAAALQILGADHRLTTRVVEGARAGEVVIVGGGDPTLAGPRAVGAYGPGYPAPARLTDLAEQTASALRVKGVTTVRVGYDASLFTGAAIGAGWKPTYVSEGDVAPVSALEVDEGRPDLTKPARVGDPAAAAAAEFAALLTADGIAVTGSPAPASAAGSTTTLGSVSSPPVAALVQRMLGRSDNDLAEALARQVAIAGGLPATFSGGAQAVRAALTSLGVDASGFAMVDASGLSPADRVEPAALVQLLRLAVAPGHAQLVPMLTALPVAGFSGTLGSRFGGSAATADGLVRAKTGTLDGVAALAGYVDDHSGATLVFAIVANGAAVGATTVTEAALDRIAAGLAACGCA